jgi:hypothetical protein
MGDYCLIAWVSGEYAMGWLLHNDTCVHPIRDVHIKLQAVQHNGCQRFWFCFIQLYHIQSVTSYRFTAGMVVYVIKKE